MDRGGGLLSDITGVEHLRTGCDLMNVFFVFDEYTDVEDADVVREMVDIVIDAIRHPEKPRPEGEVLLGELARQCVCSPLTQSLAHISPLDFGHGAFRPAR